MPYNETPTTKERTMITDLKTTINNEVNEALIEGGYEVNPHTRKALMEGLRDSWKEDPDTSIEKSKWQLALSMLILEETVKTHSYPQ